jgi:predicted RNA-binding Zn-ribbon protein involved in translation (DUF1610 family)
MATRPCPDCGQPVGERADRCPHCGSVMPRDFLSRLLSLQTILSVVIILFLQEIMLSR